MARIIPGSPAKEIVDTLRSAKGYYLTNTARDLSQSDFKNRLLLHTDLIAAEKRDNAGYFSLEITGGASIHVDMLRKQVNPFTKLRKLREKMPNTMFQTLCRGVNLFGYRPYPKNIVRFTVREFAKYVDVWRTFDFLNHVPNMTAVFEEVARAGRLNEPCLCFSTGPEHTNEFYVKKAQEIIDVTGRDITLCIKNHGGLGSPVRIGELVDALKQNFGDIPIHYHGHNTDGNDVGRIVEAVKNGASIVDAADSAFTGFYGPPPILSVVQTLREYGFHPEGLDEDAVIETSEIIRDERVYYEQFESQIKGFQPTVQIHKLPGGAMGSSLEQASKGGFLDKMPEILHKELPRVQKELGNYWSVTPGSQILWTTAVANVLDGERYGNPSGDLRNLLLGKYGPFPFYQPEDWIYEKVLGENWRQVLEEEGGIEEIADIDLALERYELSSLIGVEPTDEQLVLYLQHPNDAVDFFKFEEKYGQVHVLPPSIFFRKGGFYQGEKLSFRDYHGKEHMIEVGPSPVTNSGETSVYLMVDHHQTIYTYQKKTAAGGDAAVQVLTKEEIIDLAKAGDVRSPFNGKIVEISVEEGQEVLVGDRVAIMEAMKMQTPILCEMAGIVTAISAKKGDTMHPGAKILKIDLNE
ncbi:biotin/lipoyl-containing protein [Desulforhopalus singaporensis]|uniref:Pyruvate carboxylase n=1 Tax=Desulforhopalus singaporensis TaxID=91360 RepID=A0A1H0NDZ3_9BACT|nr:biotin/lipoyl-containing protein [Desulforhopalus singaporensis]SDO90934.1 pyruvate carboxylase [Desulforhopalus singaporensis]